MPLDTINFLLFLTIAVLGVVALYIIYHAKKSNSEKKLEKEQQ